MLLNLKAKLYKTYVYDMHYSKLTSFCQGNYIEFQKISITHLIY